MKDQILHSTAIITGASGNLGAAVATKCIDAKFNVVLVDREREMLINLFQESIDSGQALLGAPVDVTDRASMESLVSDVLENYGRIDALVNTVGGFRSGDPVHKTPDEVWDFMFYINLRSVIVASSAVIPTMIEGQRGKIVNIASRNALRGKANSAAYGAAKSSVMRITESMSAELKKYNINVNCIIPGTIDSPQNREQMPSADTSRWVQPESIAEVILFLISDAARDIHAAAIPVTGLT